MFEGEGMKACKINEERTIGYIVQDKAKTHGSRTFLWFKDEQYSFAELNEKSNRIANALLNMGTKKGDKIATMIPNMPEYFYIWWGILKIGVLHVPISPNYRGASLLKLINRSEAKILIMYDDFLEHKFFNIQEQLKNATDLVVAHRLNQKKSEYNKNLIKLRTHDLADFMEFSTEYPQVDVYNYDPSCIIFTSGTTGPPKAVIHTHEFWIHGAETKNKHMGTNNEDVIYNCFPMYNPTGQVETSLCALMADAQLALAEEFNHENFWNDIRKYNCTEGVSMGGMFALVEKNPPSPDDLNHPLKKIYIIPLPLDFQKRCEKRFGVRMMEIYGQTEAGLVSFNSWDIAKPGSCGIANGGYEIKIFDENDNECPTEVPGEIVIRPKKSHIIAKGYYDTPEKFGARMSNCWWHTGDLGHIDKDGYLFFHCRKEETIRFRGQFVSTTEVEKIINNHEDVLECAVFGVPDENNQEQDVMVCIKARSGHQLRPEEILIHCEKDLPYYMIPCYVRIIEEFEKTPTMRIIKKPLEQKGVTPETWSRRQAKYKLSKK